jgi:hypothetical protein
MRRARRSSSLEARSQSSKRSIRRQRDEALIGRLEGATAPLWVALRKAIEVARD